MNARSNTYTICFLAAVGLHAGVLYGSSRLFESRADWGISAGQSVELTLVETAEELAPEVAFEPPEPVMELPEPEPEIKPPEPEPEIEPPPPEPEPVVEAVIEPPKPAPKPASTPPPVPKRAATAATKASPASGRRDGPAAPARGASGVRVEAKPNYLRNPPPPYPAASKRAREQGVVLLRVSVSKDGRAAAVRLQRSSGYPRLDEAAQRAVQRWRFSPARIGGIATEAEVEVPVRFQLK